MQILSLSIDGTVEELYYDVINLKEAELSCMNEILLLLICISNEFSNSARYNYPNASKRELLNTQIQKSISIETNLSKGDILGIKEVIKSNFFEANIYISIVSINNELESFMNSDKEVYSLTYKNSFIEKEYLSLAARNAWLMSLDNMYDINKLILDSKSPKVLKKDFKKSYKENIFMEETVEENPIDQNISQFNPMNRLEDN